MPPEEVNAIADGSQTAVQLGHPDHLVHLELQEITAHQVSQDWLDKPAPQDKVMEVPRLAFRAQLARQDPQDPMVLQDSPARMETQDSLETLDDQATQDLKDRPEMLEQMEIRENRVSLDNPVNQDREPPLEPLARKDLQEIRDHLVFLESLDRLHHLEPPAQQDQLDLLVNQDSLDRMGSLDIQVRLEFQARMLHIVPAHPELAKPFTRHQTQNQDTVSVPSRQPRPNCYHTRAENTQKISAIAISINTYKTVLKFFSQLCIFASSIMVNKD